MCPLDNNISSLSNQDLTATAILITDNESDIIDQTKKNIIQLRNITLRIHHYINYINLYQDSKEIKYQNKIKLYLSNLTEIYTRVPKFLKSEEIVNTNKCWENSKKVIAVCAVGIGLAIRVAQRYFSVAVVSNKDIIGQNFFQQLQILGKGMYDALGIKENWVMGFTDTIFSYGLSYYPFGLKDIVGLFTAEQDSSSTTLNPYLPFEIIINELQNSLERKEYQQLETFNSKINVLCDDLKEIFNKHDAINHYKDELQETDFNSHFSFAEFNQLINSINTDDGIVSFLADLNNLAKTNLKNENDSWSAIIKNGKSNLLSFCTVLAINHLVITASSAYTAETLTWESYPIKLLSIPNILSTVVRATVMKLVNEYCIKDGLSIIFKLIRKYCCCNLATTDNNSENLIVKMKNWVNKQNKPMQSLLLVSSFLVTCALTNAIKTYAADITQNKGDSEAAWKQFKRTFFRWGMVLSALGVTASDLYNLTQEMKPFLKLKHQSKQNQEIIEKALLELSNSIVNNSTSDLDDEPLITIEDRNLDASDIDDDPLISITDEIHNINGISSLANEDINSLSPWNETDSTYPINNDHEILINNNSRAVKTCTIS